MGKLESLYHEIQSIAITEDFTEKMIQLYIDTKPVSNRDFYASILNGHQEVPTQINEKEKNALYFEVWKEWKESILNLSEEQLKHPYDTDYSSDELIFLKNSMLKFPDTKTWDETLTNLKEQESLYQFFFDEFIGTAHSKWCQIERHKIKIENTLKGKIGHRLYLNCSMSDIHFLIRRLREKFEARNLDYRLKFDTSEETRDDKVILYSDTAHLIDYITILKEIERDYPEFMKQALNTPLLTGKIDHWIGYGEEPVYQEESYNDMRSHILYHCITMSTLEKLIEDESSLRQMAKYFIEVKKIVPIDDSDIDTIYQRLILKLKEEIKCYCNDTQYETKGLLEMKQILFMIMKKYLETDSTYLEKITDEIKKEMERCYIDPKKICFHLDTLEKFHLYDKKESIDEKTFLDSLKITIQPSYFQVGNGIYQSIKNILYMKFTKLIMMDGTVYTKDNQKIKAKYFLENLVNDEFTKEKMIYAEIYQENMRGNIGKIKLDEENSVTPWEFTEYLGDSLLEEKISFQGDTVMSVRECMKELECYLPESGIIYHAYGRKMKLLDFLKQSFRNKNQFLYYKNIVFWFYEQINHNPGFFLIQKNDVIEEDIELKGIEVQKLLIS